MLAHRFGPGSPSSWPSGSRCCAVRGGVGTTSRRCKRCSHARYETRPRSRSCTRATWRGGSGGRCRPPSSSPPTSRSLRTPAPSSAGTTSSPRRRTNGSTHPRPISRPCGGSSTRRPMGVPLSRARSERTTRAGAPGCRPDPARWVREDAGAGVARLGAAGYEPMDEGMIGFTIDLPALDLGGPDDRVRAVMPGDDLRPRTSVTRAAFRVDKPVDRYVAEYEAFTRSPAYPRGWDLVAWAASRAAACTIAWPDPVSGVGNFEPVATHPDFLRQGFATAVMRDGLRRLRDAGMRRAVVYTVLDNDAGIALYRSVGFREDHIMRWFHRS